MKNIGNQLSNNTPGTSCVNTTWLSIDESYRFSKIWSHLPVLTRLPFSACALKIIPNYTQSKQFEKGQIRYCSSLLQICLIIWLLLTFVALDKGNALIGLMKEQGINCTCKTLMSAEKKKKNHRPSCTILVNLFDNELVFTTNMKASLF